jgi:ACR3 family arsenite efflux pump ArsB
MTKGERKMRKYLEKIQDFRLLPFFVIISMAIGLGIGKYYGISNFQLTAPIDAIKSILDGTYQFTLANTLALGVVIGLFLMMYPAMTNVKVEDLGKAARSPKQLLIVLFFNFLIAPFFMLLLAKLFLSDDQDLYVGLVLYGLAPCIAMVIVFTFGFTALIPAIIIVQQKVVTGILLIILFAIGHCLPIVIAGSSTAVVRGVLESGFWTGAGAWFRKGAGALIISCSACISSAIPSLSTEDGAAAV